MTNSILTRLAALLVLLALCPGRSPAQEYVLTVANEQLRFVAQPEAGYVVKAQEKTRGISALSSTLSFLHAENAKPIHGLDRRGVWVIEDKRPAGENEKTIKTLRANRQIEYVAPLFSVNGETIAVIPEIVIRVSPGVDERAVHFLCQSMALAIIKPMEFTTQEYLLQVLGSDAEAVFTAVEKLNEVDLIEWACPNTASKPKLCGKSAPSVGDSGEQLRLASAGQDANSPGVFPNDPYFPMQWHLHNTGQSGGTPGADIRAPEAWEITTGDPNIVIAVIDCGVDSNHPDLVNNLISGYDFYENDEETNPVLNIWIDAHGTACAGLVAAQGNNRIGVTGVAYNCKIMPIRDGDALSLITQAEEATAFRWAAANGADVLSVSMVWSNVPILHTAIQDVTMSGGIGREGKGCVALFAAGNSGQSIQAGRTSTYPEVIAVGGVDHNDYRCWYSSYGPELDIAAPSGGGIVFPDFGKHIEEYSRLSTDLIWTTDILGDFGHSIFNQNPTLLDYTEKFAGTSAACPIAAGVAALILSIEPNLTSDEVRHFLERSAKDLGDPGRDDYYGWGRVDARAALDMVLAKRCDLNNDWKVDEQDLAILNAAIDTNDLSADIAPAVKRDGKVDANDLELLTRYLGIVIPEMGLIAHWKLDETEGIIAHDSAGPHGAFVISLNPLWRPNNGKVNGALEFDGIDDYVSTPFVLNPSSGSFSVFAWVKGGAPGQVIISQAAGANWLLADPSAGKLMTSLTRPPGGRVAPPPLVSEFVITDGNWHHVGFSWNGSNRVLYVDDTEVAKDTQDSLASSAGGLYFGAGKGLEPGSFWSGLIDDVRIYNRAMTP